jgi:hypothetical protein
MKAGSGSRSYRSASFSIWFADGSALTGNEYVELKQSIGVYPKDKIIAWDWSGVNIQSESQHVFPKIEDSIQYDVIRRLKQQDYDIIYDDDYSGEIADVVAIKLEEEKICIEMYHLKYAYKGKISNEIRNFYEVCGQAQKSIHWKHKNGKQLINIFYDARQSQKMATPVADLRRNPI